MFTLRLSLLTITFFLSLSAFAQINQLKLYGNASVLKAGVFPSEVWQEAESFLDYKHLSFAYAFGKDEDHLHQIELNRFLYDSSPLLGDGYAMDLRLQYSRNKLFYKSPLGAVYFYGGPLVNLSFSGTDINPFFSNSFPFTRFVTGLSFGLNLEFRFSLGDHFFIATRLPFELITIARSIERREDPTLTLAQQRSSDFEYRFFDSNFFPGLGLGYQF